MSKHLKIILTTLLTCFVLLIDAGNIHAEERDVCTSIVELVQEGEDYVYLRWSASEEADGYSIYRSKDNGVLSLVKNVTTTETYNYGLNNGSFYSYTIRPYAYDENQNKAYGSFSNSVGIQIGVKIPTSIKATAISESSVNITWDGDPLADGYTLYRSDDAEKWTMVKSVNDTSTTTYGLKSDLVYYFRLKTYRVINGKKRYSDYSDEVCVHTGLNTPDELTATPASVDSVLLTWKPVLDATGYRIYRSDDGGEFKLIKTVNSPSTKNYSLQNDKNYIYKVAAIKILSNNSTIKSAYSAEVSIHLGLDDVSELHITQNTSNSVRLSWTEVPQANAYRVYRTDEDGTTKLIKTVSSNETTTYGIFQDFTYAFSIKPVWIGQDYTLNGNCSEPFYYYAHKKIDLCVSQVEINTVMLTWNAISSAEKYVIYGIENGVSTIIQETSEESCSISISDNSFTEYAISAVRKGCESAPAKICITKLIRDPEYSSLSISTVSNKQISLIWEPVEYAIGYEIKRINKSSGEENIYQISAETNYTDTNVNLSQTYIYSYRIQYLFTGYRFYGDWLPAKEVAMPKKPTYRALLIGEEHYVEPLRGPINDINAMNDVLNEFNVMNWRTIKQEDSTKNEIISLINLAFDGATENDISMFYYSGHGVTGSGEYYSGALMTVDYEYITIKDLAELLSKVPGRVIVILDSCGSGAAVSDQSPIAPQAIGTFFDANAFNSEVIDIFSSYNSNEVSKSQEFISDKFYVLTASGYEENSSSVMINNIWGGAFTRGITESCGYVYNSRNWNQTMNGDVDHDDVLTLQECFSYASDFASKYQNAQVYPKNSAFELFYK